MIIELEFKYNDEHYKNNVVQIERGKIGKYFGHRIRAENILFGNGEKMTKVLNTDFNIESVNKFEQEKFGVTGNYKLTRVAITSITSATPYIYLNQFQFLSIKWQLKNTAWHRIDAMDKLYGALIISLPLSLLISWLTYIYFKC